jgi:hypothetical protein
VMAQVATVLVLDGKVAGYTTLNLTLRRVA